MKKLICIIVTLLFAFSTMAQPPRDGKMGRKEFSPEQFEKRMEDFITRKANLTSEEQAKLFPLLKEMLDAQRHIGEKQRKMQKPEKDPSEEECKKIIQNMTDMEVQHKKIEQTYFTKKFPSVLSYKKILKVRMAMDRFKMVALRQFSPQQRNGAGRPHKDDSRDR